MRKRELHIYAVLCAFVSSGFSLGAIIKAFGNEGMMNVFHALAAFVFYWIFYYFMIDVFFNKKY